MKFVARMVLAVGFAAGLAATASAQRPGGGGGMGMGGGMQSVYVLTATNKTLQEELKITDAQKDKITEALKPLAEKRREMLGGGGGRDASDEQRKEMAEKMAKLSDETKKAVEGVLEEKQKTRLSEIHIQNMGFRAYSDKGVQEKLKLTDAQKEKVKGVAETYAKDMAELNKDRPMGGRGGRPSEDDQKKMADYRKKIDELRKGAEEKVVAELTSEQKDSWKKMVGEKFDTSKLQGFAGGAGGGQRGQRPRQN